MRFDLSCNNVNRYNARTILYEQLSYHICMDLIEITILPENQ